MKYENMTNVLLATSLEAGPVVSYKLRYIVGFRLVPEYKTIPQIELILGREIVSSLGIVEMAISTNQKPTVSRNLYENAGPAASIC